MRYIILFNPHDRDSREFVRQYGHLADLLNWVEDHDARESFVASGKPSPSGFPCVYDTQTNFITGVALNFDSAVQTLADLAAPEEDRYKVNRLRSYYEQGLNADSWTRARIQFEEDGDESELNRLRQIRAEIKSKYPKPPQE